MTDQSCTNYTGSRWPRRCQRTATGDDGLCNICRAAKSRGKAKADATYAAGQAAYLRREQVLTARRSLIDTATLWHENSATNGDLHAAIAAYLAARA